LKGIILIDTREQQFKHITNELDRLQIVWKIKKLSWGDYSFEWNSKSYENEIVIERKGSLDEIIGNFTKGRERFKREFERAKGCKLILIVESSMEQLENHEYRSRMSPKDLKSFLNTWCNKFQLELIFINKSDACNCMLNCFRNYFNGGQHE